MLGSFRSSTRDSTESEVDLALFALKQIQQEAANIRFQVYRGRRLVDRCVCLIKPLKVRASACLLHEELICVLTCDAGCWDGLFWLRRSAGRCPRPSKSEVEGDMDGAQFENSTRY
jgi:hypothetical protein